MTLVRLNADLLDELGLEAARSIRLRKHHNIHKSYEDPCQKLLNAIGVNSYIRPHRHSPDPKTESLIALRGIFALLTFTDEGTVEEIIPFGTEKYCKTPNLSVAIELSPDTWHTVLALVPGSVLFELKAGPFDPAAAKEPALWAPEEGSPEAASYLQSLRTLSARSVGLPESLQGL